MNPNSSNAGVTTKSLVDDVRRVAPAGSTLPVVITPLKSGELLLDALERLQVQIEEAVSSVGGVLLRGFDVPSVKAFQQFAAGFGHPLLSYDFGSTPRTAVGGGVYTSTEYPAHQHIPLHNEQAYTREWEMKRWFHCVAAADALFKDEVKVVVAMAEPHGNLDGFLGESK